MSSVFHDDYGGDDEPVMPNQSPRTVPLSEKKLPAPEEPTNLRIVSVSSLSFVGTDGQSHSLTPGPEYETAKCRKWREFHALNPKLMKILVELIYKAKARGYEQWSISGAVEIARWHPDYFSETHGVWDFKISNDFRAYYARQIMMENPDLYGFLEAKKADADHELGWLSFKATMGC